MSETWQKATKDHWLVGTFLVSAVGVVWLFWPFFQVLVYASVVAVVAEPLHERITLRLGGRRLLAAVLTASAFALLVLLPLGVLLGLFARQGIAFAGQGLEWVSQGHLEAWLLTHQGALEAQISAWTGRSGPNAFRLPDYTDTVQQVVTVALATAGDVLPSVLSGLITGTIGAVIFVLTVITLLAEGPRLATFVTELTPLEDRYERQMIAVFREFAFNMVIGVFVVAITQGVVASIGYSIFGMPRPVFFGMLTGMGAFLPIIGTAVVAGPMCVWAFVDQGPVVGTLMVLWSVLVVGTVDNLLRPMIIRGSSNIHPLLVFLAVFGGLWWLGITGVLVGPVMVAMFLALAKIYREEILRLPPNGSHRS